LCGRYTLTSPERAIREVLELDAGAEALSPRFNVAPTQPMPVRRGSELALLRWGFRSVGTTLLINARSETLRTKPSFREAFKVRRCLVPADGFYEWTRGPKNTRQPWWIHAPDRRPFAFAGLWEEDLFTIVTCEARGAIRELHDRMPVMLFDRATRAAWLEAEADDGVLDRLLEPQPTPMVFHPVSRAVNRNEFEDPTAIEAIALPAPEPARPVQGLLFGPEA
jgi:putative SOS response-associated peptidase YedK